MREVDKHFGDLDILLCNAGGNPVRGAIDKIDPAAWIAAMNLNVTGAFLTARAAIPLMKARGGGRIVMTGSGMGHRGSPGHSAYCCGKAAQWMLVRCLAQELVEDKISVNELIPGPVITPATLKERDEDGFPAAFELPGEWVKQPEDVVPMAIYLATCPPPGSTAQSFSLMRRQG
jgi:3-oxoacyl-[acyl-carrier protein] reductase